MNCPICGDRMEFSHSDDETCFYVCPSCGTEGEMPMEPDEEFVTGHDDDCAPTPTTHEDVSEWL